MMKGGDVKVGIAIYPATPGVSHGPSPAPSLGSFENRSGNTVADWTGNSIFPPT